MQYVLLSRTGIYILENTERIYEQSITDRLTVEELFGPGNHTDKDRCANNNMDMQILYHD